MTSILVVDDERSVREGLARVFSAAGWHVLLAADLAGARDALADEVACVVLDVRLPDGDGIAFLDELRSAQPRLPVILATAYGDSDLTITAMRLGAFEYVTKPFDLDALLAVVRRAVETPAAAAAPSEPPSDATLIGSSARMLEIWKAIGRASAADVPALITGESGVGKELVARAIHQNSARRGAPFVAVNLAALPPTLIESELFGHEKGAFTGAVGRREGRFEAASEGTLFLDEIGDLDVPLQTKLLRVLQDGTFERVGSQEPLKSNARVLAATSKPVEPGAPNAALREDLFYRISVVRLQIPPLRERRSDIPLLVEHYLRRLPGLRRAVSEAAMELLSGHGWPGNVRELHHVLERAAVMSTAEVLDVQDFQLPARPPGGAVEESGELHLKRATAALETRLIRAALLRANGNRAEAARLLGIARPQLYVKMKELGIDPQ
jgi:DNA-binding NtrC family response regulator